MTAMASSNSGVTVRSKYARVGKLLKSTGSVSPLLSLDADDILHTAIAMVPHLYTTQHAVGEGGARRPFSDI